MAEVSGHKLHIGCCYWFPTGGGSEPHLHFVVASAGDKGFIVVNITDPKHLPMENCFLNPTDHRDISKKSVVYCNVASFVTQAAFDGYVRRGTARLTYPARPEVIDFIREGMRNSGYTPLGIERLIPKKKLVPELPATGTEGR